jgi:PIN domain nuclease of toxin-antitoxin system
MILLDTHIWVRWLISSDNIGPELTELIEDSDDVCVFSISC